MNKLISLFNLTLIHATKTPHDKPSYLLAYQIEFLNELTHFKHGYKEKLPSDILSSLDEQTRHEYIKHILQNNKCEKTPEIAGCTTSSNGYYRIAKQTRPTYMNNIELFNALATNTRHTYEAIPPFQAVYDIFLESTQTYRLKLYRRHMLLATYTINTREYTYIGNYRCTTLNTISNAYDSDIEHNNKIAKKIIKLFQEYSYFITQIETLFKKNKDNKIFLNILIQIASTTPLLTDDTNIILTDHYNLDIEALIKLFTIKLGTITLKIQQEIFKQEEPLSITKLLSYKNILDFIQTMITLESNHAITQEYQNFWMSQITIINQFQISHQTINIIDLCDSYHNMLTRLESLITNPIDSKILNLIIKTTSATHLDDKPTLKNSLKTNLILQSQKEPPENNKHISLIIAQQYPKILNFIATIGHVDICPNTDDSYLNTIKYKLYKRLEQPDWHMKPNNNALLALCRLYIKVINQIKNFLDPTINQQHLAQIVSKKTLLYADIPEERQPLEERIKKLAHKIGNITIKAIEEIIEQETARSRNKLLHYHATFVAIQLKLTPSKK